MQGAAAAKRLYFIRHAKPDFPRGGRMCLGLTDLPLGRTGKLQACLLGEEFKKFSLKKACSSYLSRAVQTAAFLSPEPEMVIGLEEMSAGIWDGQLLSRIRESWPELYAQRSLDPSTPIPGSEDLYMGQERFYSAVRDIMEEAEGDTAIVAHSTVIQSFLCAVMGIEPTEGRKYKMDFCAHSTFDYDGEFHLVEMNVPPVKKLSSESCVKLLKAMELPNGIINHSLSVAEEAVMIAQALNSCGRELELIENAALLHDICRREENHAAAGAELMDELGFPYIADIIGQHHELKADNIDKAAIVYLADKLIKDDKKLPLEERFALSAEKCRSSEAKAAHERCREQAKALLYKVEQIIGMSLPL